MQQITDWLRKHVRVCVEKCIDLSDLLDLSDQDLEKLGVLLGHRCKILRAISNLGDGTVFRVIREIQKRYFQPLEIAPS